MRKTKWNNLFGTILSGATLTTVMVTANHLAKKYGQKPNNVKLYDVSIGKVIDYGINKFLNTDDKELIDAAEKVTDNK